VCRLLCLLLTAPPAPPPPPPQAFEVVKARTSVMPFQAIWEGRQQLPDDYYKEFLRVPYLAVTAFTLGAYWAHPLMQQASYWLKW
jgi:zeta-carotene isomerase